MKQALEPFQRFYTQQLAKADLSSLREVYSPHVVFIDPVDRLAGINALESYFQHLMNGLESCHFDISTIQAGDAEAFVIWQMRICHPRVRGGAEICIDGASHLKFTSQIDYHRDYYDLGAMLYEHLPLLGRAVRRLKRRLTL